MLTYSQDETQPWLTLKGPPFSASKSGHCSLIRTVRTALAATASEMTKHRLTEGLQGLQPRFTRVDGAKGCSSFAQGPGQLF